MIYIVRINDTEYEVDVEQGQAEIIRTEAIAAPVAVAAQAAAPAAAPSGPITGEPVSAPMPGGIFDIKVKPGDAVKEGQLLVILEAMKMENEILAPKAGIVKDILVTKGSTVETGDILVTIQ